VGTFGYLASNRLGLAYWHRGQLQKGWSAEDIRAAREYFSGTISAMDLQGIDQDWPTLVDIIFQTACNFGQMCNEVGTLDGVNYPKLFHADVVKIQEKLPSIRTRFDGHKLLIEDGKAMASLGLAEAAIAQLNQVSNWAQEIPGWGRAADQLAKKALNDVLGSLPSDSTIKVTPAVLFKAGEGSLRDQTFGRAIRAFQRVLTTIDAEKDPAKRQALFEEFYYQSWDHIYECYVRLERYLEAHLAVDHPVQEFLASGSKTPGKEVSNLAYLRVTTLQTLVNRAPKEQKADLQEQLKKAQELFTSRFKDTSDFGEGIGSAVANQKMIQGRGLMNSGDTARGAALLKEAIDLFAKVDPKDVKYEISQARIGECLVYMKRPEDAVKHLQAFVQKNLAAWGDASTSAPGRQPWGWSLLWLSQAHYDLNQFPKAVEYLEGYETRFQGANLDPFTPQVRNLRISALVKTGKGDEAIRECDQLMKDSPDKGYTIRSTLEVANDLKVRSDKAAAEGNKKAALDLKKRSLPYYDFWIGHSSDIAADQYTFVGSIHFEVESFKGAADNWQKALELFKAQDNVKMVDTLTISLAGLLVGQGRYAEALPQFEALFIPVPEVEELRTALAAIRRRPNNVPAAVWDKKAKDILDRMAEVLAKDPDGAAKAGEAKKVAAGAEPEVLVRAYADTPELRRALAKAAALTILGTDANLPPELKAGALALVKRSPELLANIARCYEELATATTENAIRSVNIYSTLIEASPNADDPENPPPGAKYSEKWFDWKYHWLKVYLTTGTAYKDKGESLLRTVCDVVKGMENLGELKRADLAAQDLGKKFDGLRDQADAALRAIGKEGCK
jgi:tetratricopeptide (TPR) repeat protein